MSAEHVFTTTDTTFATDVLQSPTPVLVGIQGIGVRFISLECRR
jgi:hypothetical protein